METAVYKIDSVERNRRELETAAQVLSRGGLVVFPTETVYGLGADGFNQVAVKSIYRAKGRPGDNPLILHICDTDMLPLLARAVPGQARDLALAFWPGPLTMVLPRTARVPDAVSGGLDTVAVRFPANPIARELISICKKPVAAPSANLSGGPSPTTAQHCIRDLAGRVDVILDGGPCSIGLESTVVSLTGDVPVLLRPGGVTLEQLRSVLGEVRVSPAVTHMLDEGEKAPSPGMKYKHYSPKARVVLVNADTAAYCGYVNSHNKDGVFALCFNEDIEYLNARYVCYGSCRDAASQAASLFGALRALDDLGARVVYAHCPSGSGLGLAVYNRLLRAAAFDVIDL